MDIEEARLLVADIKRRHPNDWKKFLTDKIQAEVNELFSQEKLKKEEKEKRYAESEIKKMISEVFKEMPDKKLHPEEYKVWHAKLKEIQLYM
jgi:hypothetical protein|tara:strand:+ start:436 stop:711 length:276 start_codon:yes stop_codon:yes gene_type:complete